MKTEEKVKIFRDILGMMTGFTGFMLQAIPRDWNPYALGVCALLLGVPLLNLRTLIQGGSPPTPEPLSPLPPSDSPLSSSSP